MPWTVTGMFMSPPNLTMEKVLNRAANDVTDTFYSMAVGGMVEIELEISEEEQKG